MRLLTIKLAGFKSFVDPTSIPLPGNLTGVVGPNGCGKSNVIDAVRWVMGESSAKHLRGESMADVIFNGSTARKPVGHATIELVFENADGAVGGQYASYSEIAIKRQVSRDGTSNYFLNGSRCRRRDITDIFLGTGLGPRSYSIIEQGTISRLIEARPEDLRVFLEEAAGISKYKERRRETETRIKHTRENLDRLNDLREEIDKQLQHLQRQAKTAEKYKELKQEERRIKGELLALRLRTLDGEANTQARAIAEHDNALQAAMAEQRGIEAALEKDRESHIEASDTFNEIQGRFYAVGAEIARVEQTIQHAKEMGQKQRHDLDQIEQGWRELTQLIDSDRSRLQELAERTGHDEPALQRAREAEELSQQGLTEAEERMHAWQRSWDEFTLRAAQPSEAAQVERTRIDQAERHIVQLQQRLERIRAEQQSLVDHNLGEQIQLLEQQEGQAAERESELQQALQTILQQIADVREHNRALSAELDQERGELQDVRGRLASLEALQQAALGQTEGAVSQWLEGQGLANASRLAQQLRVDSGWERALETVLGIHLEAVCVDGMDAVAGVLEGLQHGALALFDTSGAPIDTAAGTGTALLERVHAPWPLASLLAGVYTADSLSEALAMRQQLSAHESVVTRDGLWLGRAWLRVTRDADARAGVLAREQEIKQLSAQLEQLGTRVADIEEKLERGRERQHEFEQQRESGQQQVNDSHRQRADLRARLGAARAREEQFQAREASMRREIEELQQQEQRDATEAQEARARLTEALDSMERLAHERERLTAERDTARAMLDEARTRARAERDETHAIALRLEALRNQQESTRQSLARSESQLQVLGRQREDLQQALASATEPLREQESMLADFLRQRVQIDAELSATRRHVEEIEAGLRAHEQKRAGVEQSVQEARAALEQARLDAQEIKVRCQTLQEQLAETGFQQADLLENLPEDANEQSWREQTERLATRIARLGPINLAAIDEFSEQSERKVYLDSQYADVTEALETLENAIRKIDRETRTRFKETFDRVNSGLQALFPRLFGGGHAYLELTGEDLLDTGVTVMARPPGKRNSSIHLLSGGEKALTAVALVFSIFQLNPAPFCMLDEVDAPLDDANVGRFCELVKEMSEHVQFIFITHNKITMALADYLMGVTMYEPGVSRMVAVDVDEAARMAAS